MSFRQKMVLVMVWLLTLSYGVGGVLLIRQNFESSLTQIQNNDEESYKMILKTVELVNLVDIQQDLSSISDTLDKMNTAESLVGMSLKKGDQVLYKRGEEIESETENTSEFSSLMFSREYRQQSDIFFLA